MSNDQEITTDNNTKLVSYIFKKYNKNKDYVPVRNISMNIKTEKNIYKLIRLNDKQFYLLHKNSIAIFEDYWHLMYLCKDKDLIYSSCSKMYTVLKNLFGESGRYYDNYKGSFSFPFLIHFLKGDEEFGYLMNVHNVRSSIEFNFVKLISTDDDRFKRDILHKPFDEFPKEEIIYFINFFVGYLTGAFEIIAKSYDEFFFKIVDSNLILFGYKDGSFFDNHYEDIEEFNKEFKKLEHDTEKAKGSKAKGSGLHS